MEITQALALPDSSSPGNAFAYYISGNQTPTVACGPLADAMVTALDQLYKREVDPTTGVVLESQQLDQIKRNEWIMARRRMALAAGAPAPLSMLYGVKSSEASPNDLIDVAEAVGNMNDQELADSVVIVDGAMDQSTPAAVALEEFCKSLQVRVFHSFAEFSAS